MIGGAKGIGIGLDFGIGNQSRPKGSGEYLDPAVKEALCGIWIADQNTNESPTRSIIKNKIPNKGGDFEILNAAYGGMSGFNGYDYNFNSSTFNLHSVAGVKLNDHTINVLRVKNYIFMSANLRNITFKIKVTGLEEAKNRKEIEGQLIIYNSATDTGRTEIREDGIHEVNVQSGIDTGDIYFYIPGRDKSKDQVLTSPIVIEEVARYQGAFVTDGVDDLIVSEKSVSDMLGGSNEITVVSMIHQIDIPKTTALNNVVCRTVEENLDIYYNPIIEKQKTGIYGYTYNNDSIVAINNILGDKEDYKYSKGNHASYKDSYSVEGYINKGDYIYSVSQVAWYWTIIAKRVLTADEINQVIAYYNLDKYVAPDTYYDVKKQGITNENHAEFGDKLIDYSGNGKDMQLYNFGWNLDSGIGLYYQNFNNLSGGVDKSAPNGTKDSFKIHLTNTGSNPTWRFLWGTFASNKIKFKVTGIYNSSLISGVSFRANNNENNIFIDSDGIYEFDNIDTTRNDIGFSLTYINAEGNANKDIDITLEQVPSFEGALVFDGVDDYGKVEGLPIYKDYTVAADYIRLSTNGLGPVISKSKTAQNGYAIFNYVASDKKSLGTYSFGNLTNMATTDNESKIYYQSKYINQGSPINVGGGEDTDTLWMSAIRDGDVRHANIAVKSFLQYPYSLSEFLLERQLKKRKLGTLYPDMVEFRPIINANISTILNISFKLNDSQTISAGEYIPINSGVSIRIDLINYQLDEVSLLKVNGQTIQIRKLGDYWKGDFTVTKSPQKINISIDSYVLYENMDFPYPFIPNLYWDKDLKNRITWGDKVKVGSTIYGHLDTNLLPELYTHNRIIYKGQTVNMLPIIVEDYMYFGVVSKRYLKENEPKCILSPERLRLPNEVYKRIGCIPDISGHYNHGFFYNLAYTEESGATADGAIKLDGVNDYISIHNLGSGGKQVLMKVNWTNDDSIVYDQRNTLVSNNHFAIYTVADAIAYNARNNGQTFIDGVLNISILSNKLKGITHNITIANDEDTDSQNPTIGKSNYNNASYANMLLYTFMLFDEIDNDETIMELNEAIGIENNIQGGGLMVDFTTWPIVRNPVLEVSPSSIHITNIKEMNFFMEVFSTILVIPSIKIRVTGVAKGRGVAYRYCKSDGTFDSYWCETDGEHTLPESVHSQQQSYSGFRTNFIGDCDILIEQLTD